MRARVVAALLGCLLLLSGCLTLPTSGGVQQGIEGVPAEEGIDLVAQGPQPDATPHEIVSGFLAAAASGLGDDFETARDFLTDTGQARWSPNTGVTLYRDMEAITLTSDPGAEGTVTLTTDVEANVDGRGIYTEADGGSTQEFAFQLVQDGQGQWRIDELDSGVLMSVVTFGTQYRQLAVYFVAADAQARLVPDVRWVPQANGDEAAVRNLLAGPAEWLAPGVLSAFPDGTMLGLEGVTAKDGTATVDLSTEFLSAAEDRSVAIAQLEQTLRQLPQVRRVEITVGGQAQDIGSALGSLPAAPVIAENPTVLTPDGLGVVSGGGVVLGSGSVAPPEGLEAVALPYGAGPAVGLVEDGLTTVPTADNEAVVLHTGEDLLAPSYDVFGWVWTGTRGPQGTVTAVDPLTGEAAAVLAPALESGQVLDMRVSRDGARLAYLVRDGNRVHLNVAAIERDSDGVPTAVGIGRQVGPVLAGALEVAWVDEFTVAVLGSTGDVARVFLVDVGGRTSPLSSVENAIGLAVGDGRRQVYVVTAGGDLYGTSGAGWQRLVGGVESPVFPG